MTERLVRFPSGRKVLPPAGERPRLHVVVDTEEEFDWDAPFSRANTSVSAMRSIGRFQSIFDRFGVKPTYVVDYPVAAQAEGFEPLGEIFERGGCEIGAHLHPWVNPPFDEPVTGPTSFTCNLAPSLQHAKIAILTDAITRSLGVVPRVFKAGRYGVDARTLEVLVESGFEIDASVCPRYDFTSVGGPSFAACDCSVAFPLPGLLEIPCTVDYVGWAGALRPWLHRQALVFEGWPVVGALAKIGATNRIMLSPEGSTAGEMCGLAAALVRRGQRVLTMTLHSPSAAPGHTPYVRSAAELERFCRTMEQFCEYFFGTLQGRPASSSEIREWALAHVELDS